MCDSCEIIIEIKVPVICPYCSHEMSATDYMDDYTGFLTENPILDKRVIKCEECKRHYVFMTMLKASTASFQVNEEIGVHCESKFEK